MQNINLGKEEIELIQKNGIKLPDSSKGPLDIYDRKFKVK